jgi:hypothetical protein
LVEPAATNLCLRSEEFDNASWTKTDTSISANAVTAPDGSSNADKVIESATGPTSHEFFTAATFAYSASATVTLSVYAKAAERTIFQLYLVGSGRFAGAKFDLVGVTSGAGIGGSGGGYSLTSSSITAIGNGWYRCVASIATVTDTAGRLYISLCQNASTDTYTGDGTSGVYLWGAQVETDTVATSYIPTLGSTVTRATDAVNVATSTYPHSATEGAFICWFKKRIVNAAATDRIFQMNDGTANERMVCLVQTSDTPDSMSWQITDGGGEQVNPAVTKTGSVSASGNKLGTVYKANDFAIVADGAAAVTDVSGTLPTVTNLQLGYASETASREINGYIYQFTYVPRRMTDGELQTKTT